MLWDDEGPVSQGKILTAIMQGREADARKMLAGWTVTDLRALRRAADKLAVMANIAEGDKRERRRGH